MKNEAKGGLLIFLAAFLWGTGATVAKQLFRGGAIDSFELVTIRLSISFFVISFFCFAFRREILHVTFHQLVRLAVLGTAGLAMVQISYLFAVQHTSVAVAVFLQYLAPSLVVFYKTVFEKERPTIRLVGAVMLALSGTYFLVLCGSGAYSFSPWGVLGGITSAVSLSFCTIYGEKQLRQVRPLTSFVYASGFGMLLCWLFAPPWAVFMHGYDLLSWAGFMFIALGSTLLAYVCYFRSLTLIKPSRVAIISTSETVVAALSAWVMLGESLVPVQFLGAALIILSVFMVQVRQKTEIDRGITGEQAVVAGLRSRAPKGPSNFK